MRKQLVEIRESKLEKFFENKTTIIISIVLGTVAVVQFLLGPSMINKTAIQLQEQRILSQEKTITDITKIQQNDTQEVKAELKATRAEIEALELSVERLTTIVNERIPAKK